ncbi:MAG: HgcAB-associated protein HgcC [Thermodesulfobacteriota bacterium]
MPRNRGQLQPEAVRQADGCQVEAIVGIDGRGQIVLPKELRARAGIQAGDRLAVTAWRKDGGICCISLTRVEQLSEMVRNSLGPVLKDLL